MPEREDKREKTQIDGKPKFIICPKCYTKHPLSQNPIFCVECEYRFHRDKNGKLILNEESLGIDLTELKDTNLGKEANVNDLSPTRSINTTARYNQPIPYNPSWNTSRFTTPIRTWKPISGVLVPIFTFILITIITLIVMLFFIGIPQDMNDLYDTLDDMVFIFITSSLSLFFMIIPVIWIKKYYPQRLSFRERLAKLGIPINKYSRIQLFREVLFGMFIGVSGSLLVLGLQYFSFYLVEGIFSVDLTTEMESGALSDFGIAVPSNTTQLILFVLTILLFVGVPEEVLFRGFVQKSFESKFTKPAALWLTAIFFSLFHIFAYIVNPAIFIFLFIPYLGISILLGLVRNWRNDLVAAITAHIIYDITQIIILYLILS